MNGSIVVQKRLLGLFPVEVIRRYWTEIKGKTKDEMIAAVVAKQSTAEIQNFVKRFVGLTKQNVYVFKTKNLKTLPDEALLEATPLSTPAEKKTGEYNYVADLIYDTFTRLPNEVGGDVKLMFKWPIRISIRKDIVIVRCTIMEKHIQSYFPEGSIVVVRGRSMDEPDIVQKARESLPGIECGVCDLQKGIKKLWAENKIDSTVARFKTAISTDSSSMDGEKLIKKDHPAKYAEMQLAPLLKTNFKILEDTDKYLVHFSANPSSGELGFPMFSASEKAVDHVVGEILRNN